MNYWALDHWAYATVWVVVVAAMIRALLGWRRSW